MKGRYGSDELMLFTLLLYFLFFVVVVTTGIFLINIPVYLFVFISAFRYFSRDRARRQAENQKFLHLLGIARQWKNTFSRRIRDRRTHRYYICPKCVHALRVPKGKGKITITCPGCAHKLNKST